MTSDTPSSGFPPEAPSAPQHRAPLRDPRPRSALAIWTLVVTIVLGIGSWVTGIWAALIPAVLLGVVALFRIRPQVQRGKVMVIVSLLIALLSGLFSYMGTRTMHAIVDHVASGALGALGSEDPDRIDKWIATAARDLGEAARIKERFAAVVEAYGPYQGELVMPSLWFGAAAVMAPPTDLEEIGVGVGDAWSLRPGALWCKGVFRDGEVRIEMFLGKDLWEVMPKAAEDAERQVPSSVLHDMRFFRDKQP